MKFYYIKQNGYTQGIAKGKKKAVDFVNAIICKEFGQKDSFEWGKFYLGKMIIKNNGKETFTIEEAV